MLECGTRVQYWGVVLGCNNRVSYWGAVTRVQYQGLQPQRHTPPGGGALTAAGWIHWLRDGPAAPARKILAAKVINFNIYVWVVGPVCRG